MNIDLSRHTLSRVAKYNSTELWAFEITESTFQLLD